MKRFIQHEELARDSRFIRQDNAQSTVLAAMPDDVDTIVNAFEQFSDMIEQSAWSYDVLLGMYDFFAGDTAGNAVAVQGDGLPPGYHTVGATNGILQCALQNTTEGIQHAPKTQNFESWEF